MKRLLYILLLFPTIAMATAPDTTSAIVDSLIDRGTTYLKFRVYGQDTLTFPIDLRDMMGGNGKFNGVIYYRWYRGDRDTASKGTSRDSTDVKILYSYGAVSKAEKYSRTGRFIFSDDWTTIDSSKGAVQVGRASDIYTCDYQDLYSKMLNRGEYSLVVTTFDCTSTSPKTYTGNYTYNMRQHSAAAIRVIGQSLNANVKGDKAAPVDSSRFTYVDVWYVSSPSDIKNSNQPVNEWTR